jgi:hypothetical protein
MIRPREEGDEIEDDAAGQDDALGHEAASSLDEVYTAYCPYCSEENELSVDLGGGPHQSYIEDCSVCCRPWQVRVEVDDEGALHHHHEPLDE